MKLRTLQKAGSSEGFVSEASAMHERPAITMEHKKGRRRMSGIIYVVGFVVVVMAVLSVLGLR